MERIEKLKSFLESNPEDNFLQHALALEYIKAGDDHTAETLFRQILLRDPLYTGSYYHLAKLLERNNNTNAAKQTYEAGMNACKQVNDTHAFNELRAAHDELPD